MGQTLRDWYRYLEKQMHVSLPDDQQSVTPGPSSDPHIADPPVYGIDPGGVSESPHATTTVGSRAATLRRGMPAMVQQSALPLELGPLERRRGGRRPITETREEIIRRLLDPELTLHEAAAVLNISKATVRRYTDQGKLGCLRTTGGQRRFHLSALLTFLDLQAARRGSG
jgi:excisionase family DNA binding protein